MPSSLTRSIVAVGVVTVVGLLGATVASAHIDPDPAAVQAGTSATVTFGVEHGCDGSPTTALAFKVPDGIGDAAAVAKDGWTTGVADGVVSFTGGNLDPETPDTFSISFTAPATAGAVYFPVVQTCAAGQIAWIEIPADGGDEPEHPAPAVLVTDGPPSAEQLTPGHDEEGGTVDTATADHHAEETATADASDDSSNTGLIVGIVAAVVVLGGGAAVVLSRRRRGAPSA